MQPPIACTLPPDQLAARRRQISAVARSALLVREPIDGGARLRFAGDAETERAVRDIVRAERVCCAFLRFDVRRDDDVLEVEVTGPEGAQPVIAELFA